MMFTMQQTSAARLRQLGYVKFSYFVLAHRPTTPKLFTNVSPAKGMVDEFFGDIWFGTVVVFSLYRGRNCFPPNVTYNLYYYIIMIL